MEGFTAATPHSLDVAIVGGGIIGVMTALGLLHRGHRVTIYERSAAWHEVGAGFGFTAIARECMRRLDPAVLEALSAISQKTSSSAHTRYWDAFHPRTREDAESQAASLLFQMPESNMNFWGAVRSHLLLALAAMLPEDVVKFGKKLVGYDDYGGGHGDDKIVLRFADGTTAEAQVLVGCDGVHSATRALLLGADHPAAAGARFSHTVAYRTIVPMAAGVAALGENKALSACMHCAPDTNMMTYPVMNGAMLNVALFAHDPSDFPDAERMTAPATRQEVERVVGGLSPQMGEIARLFPNNASFTKWGIFDMFDHPAPTYAVGCVCVAGDAAHASSPHQGVGACMGVEDALVLCEVLDVAAARIGASSCADDGDGTGLSNPNSSRVQNKARFTPRGAIEQALQAYSQTRMERSQWLVRSSREMGEMYQWRYGPTGRDVKRCQTKLEQASRKVWDFDVEKMVAEARGTAAMS